MVIRATLNKIIDSIKLYLFWVSISQDLSVFLLKRIVRIFKRHELVQWDKCPGLCTCPTLSLPLVATCHGQALMSSPARAMHACVDYELHLFGMSKPAQIYRFRLFCSLHVLYGNTSCSGPGPGCWTKSYSYTYHKS